jgi:tRNA-dihydrouridine synthase
MNGQNNDAIRSLYKDKLMLAPLVGGSDLSFRLLVRHYGAQVTFTEMCVAEYYIDRMKKRVKQYTYEFDPRDRPLILQLAGNSAEPIIKMANDDLFKGKIDGVDLNCGCPQSFALEKGYGCALLRNPDHLADMCMQIVRNIPYPLSVKIRLHDNVQTTIHILQRLRAVGVAAITVHGRYYWQKGEKRGVNDWEAIKQIKESLFDMPVIGNGDVTCFDDFRRFKEFSGVDSVMSGYGALLNPSLFQPNIIPLEEILEQYISIARQHQNKFIDILRHIAWILKQHVVPGFKAQLFECKNLEQVRSLFVF